MHLSILDIGHGIPNKNKETLHPDKIFMCRKDTPLYSRTYLLGEVVRN
jgi:hypothetical protein